MLDRLGFFNHYGNGDIFESREFVRELMEIFPAKEYVYYTSKSPKILADIDGLKVSDDFPSFIHAMIPFLEVGDELYINTWIGRDSRYVLPGIGCTVEKLYEMYNHMLGDMGSDRRLSKSTVNYLTDFDYSCYNTEDIDVAMRYRKDRYLVFVSNGPVHSNQAENFDMSELIARLADSFSESSVVFFVTSPLNVSHQRSNIIDANAFIGIEGSNLVELSYLSTFCNLLVGRNSGPHVFTWTKQNCMDANKVNLTLTKRPECSHFAHLTPIKMRKGWSNETNINKLYAFISEVITKELEGRVA